MTLQRLPREKATAFLLDYRADPVLKVRLGESFIIECEDALQGAIRTPDKLPTPEVMPGFKVIPAEENPVGGPVYIEGVQKGDTLVVNIEKIIVDSQGVTCWTNHSGGIFGPGTLWPELEPPYSHIIKHLPGPSGTTRDGKGVLNEFQNDFRKVTWDLAPFIGTFAVAPEREIEIWMSATLKKAPKSICRSIMTVGCCSVAMSMPAREIPNFTALLTNAGLRLPSVVTLLRIKRFPIPDWRRLTP